jgi:uncharacterized membrane protein YhaH (DUF805 family)
MDWKTLLFTASGRINRGKFWLVVLITFLLYIAAGIIFAIFAAVLGATVGSIVGGLAIAAAAIVAVWSGIASAIKRLHDREKSGWYLLVFYLVPGVVSGVGQLLGDIVSILFSLVAFAISIWGFVEMGCLKGTTGPNMYGPDPLPAEPD